MGGCLILESLVLFHWCESNGLGPLGVTGMSMGGHVSAFYLSCIHVCVNPVSVLRTVDVTDVTHLSIFLALLANHATILSFCEK